MRSALLSQLVGDQPERDDANQAVQSLLARLNSAMGLFTPAEEALLRQWLRTLAERSEPVPGNAGGVAPATSRQVARRKDREMSNTTNEKFIADHLLGGQDRVPRLGYGAMQLAGPGVIGLPED